MTRRDFGKPAFSLRKKRFVKTHALSLLGTTRLLSRSVGGSFNRVSEPDGIEDLGHTLSFTWDRRVPDEGSIYACFDTDVAIKAWKKDYPKISEFGKLI
jgi:hypothetical protein